MLGRARASGQQHDRAGAQQQQQQMPQLQLPPIGLLALRDEPHRRKHQLLRHLPHHQMQHDRHRHQGEPR